MKTFPTFSPLRSGLRAGAGLLAVSLALLPLAASADELAEILPEEVIVFGEVRSFPKLLETKDLPMVKKLREGELGKFIKALMEKGEEGSKSAAIIKDETGLTEEELLAKFTGGAAMGVVLPLERLTDLSEVQNENTGALLVADFSGDEELVKKTLTAVDKIAETNEEAKNQASDKANAEDEDEEDADADDVETDEDDKPEANWPGDYEETVTDVEGAAVHEWTIRDTDKMSGSKFAWSLANGRLIFGVDAVDTREAVRRQMKKSADGSLASTPVYREIEQGAGEWDVLGGMNLERALAAIQEGIRLKMEKGEWNTGLPFNPLEAWAGAGLDQLRAAYMAMDLQGTEAEILASLTYSRKPAVLKLYATNGPGEPPLFAPVDAQDVSWGTMDWGRVFDALVELATAVSPVAAGGLESGMNAVEAQIGVNIRKDILGQMGDNWWSLSKTPPVDPDAKEEEEEEVDEEDPLSSLGIGQQSQLLGIALRDAKAFELSLKSIFNKVAPGQALFEDRDYMGSTIHDVKGTPAKLGLSWLIKAETLMVSVGTPEMLEKALAGMEKKPSPPLLEQDHVKEAFAKMPAGWNSSAYTDAGSMLDLILQGMKVGMEASGEEDKLEGLPDKVDLPLFVVSRTWLSDKSFDVRVRLAPKP